MAAVAETAGTREETVFGNKRVVKAALTSVDNTETWVSGLSSITWWQFKPSTNDAIGGTVSGGTITFVGGTALAGDIIAIGT